LPLPVFPGATGQDFGTYFGFFARPSILAVAVSATFSQTLRSLEAEGNRRPLVGILLGLALLGAWGAWFFGARVRVLETSEAARLEVDLAAHAIDAPVAGRIASSRFTIGAEVAAGDVLLEIDSEPEKRRLDEATTRLATIGPEIAALERAVAAQEQAIASDRGATVIALNEARARQEEAEISRRLAVDEAARAGRLRDSGSIPELELVRKESEADRQRASTQALSLDVDRQQGNQKTREAQARAQVEDLRRDLVTLEGQRSTTRATIDLLRYEIDRRTIRAPIGGHIGDLAELRAGAYVKEGDKLGAIVPSGDVKVVAEYLPAAALGRIRPGQRAIVRLDGYPWIEYGTLPASVTAVGSELRAGHIRVELAVHPEPGSLLPLEHGLPGSVEVEVERVAPATLVLRTIGKTLARRAVSSPGSDAPAEQVEARP
jgi:membrane fusion protein (multidrug efflux system)